MPLNPGALTIAFNPPGRFQVDRLHTIPASSGLSPFNQPGCTKQVTSVKDKVNDTAYAEATDKFITPYNGNTAQVDAEWYITYNSINYRVVGSHRTPDEWGRITHCTFITKQENG